MKNEIWDLRIYDLFCLNCPGGPKMNFDGFEKGSNVGNGKIINSDFYETDDSETHYFLNFTCPDCKNQSSIMTH